jgi:hypothetical protein
MGLRRGSPLACSINMRGGLGTPTLHHVKTLAATSSSSQLNPETLVAREVLAHPRVVFHPCMCGLCGGAAAVAATLISYNVVEVAVGTITRSSRSWSTTSSTPTCDYVGLLLQLFFHCSARLVITIHDLLLTSFLGWHGRISASVAYPYPYVSINNFQLKTQMEMFSLAFLFFSFLSRDGYMSSVWELEFIVCFGEM